MVTQNTQRRPTPSVLRQDLDALNGFKTVTGYAPSRPEATSTVIEAAYSAMLAKQSAETAQLALAKAATDAARLAEWEFHNTILAMKETIRGQYGPDSDEAQAVGYKKKSERKARTSRKTLPAS